MIGSCNNGNYLGVYKSCWNVEIDQYFDPFLSQHIRQNVNNLRAPYTWQILSLKNICGELVVLIRQKVLNFTKQEFQWTQHHIYTLWVQKTLRNTQVLI